jgi:hypothetical protein
MQSTKSAKGGGCDHCGKPIHGSDYFQLKDEIWYGAGLKKVDVLCTKCMGKVLKRAIRCSDLSTTLPLWGRADLLEYGEGMLDAIRGKIPRREGLYRAGFDFGLKVRTASTQEERAAFLKAAAGEELIPPS